MAFYTAEVRWGSGADIWTRDPQLRMTCCDLAQLDSDIEDRLLASVPDEVAATLQIVAETAHGSFTVAEFGGVAVDLHRKYRAGRRSGFRSADVTHRDHDTGNSLRE